MRRTAAGAAARARTARPVGGQVEHGQLARERLPPVGQLGSRHRLRPTDRAATGRNPRTGSAIPAAATACPARRRRKVRAEFAQQHAVAPAVGDDVVQRDEQQMFAAPRAAPAGRGSPARARGRRAAAPPRPADARARRARSAAGKSRTSTSGTGGQRPARSPAAAAPFRNETSSAGSRAGARSPGTRVPAPAGPAVRSGARPWACSTPDCRPARVGPAARNAVGPPSRETRTRPRSRPRAARRKGGRVRRRRFTGDGQRGRRSFRRTRFVG